MVMLLLSWSVLIIGGFTYLLFKESTNYKPNLFLVVAIFLLLFSIYYGISCLTAIADLLEKGSIHGSLDKSLWKLIQLFQQAVFIAIISIIWSYSPVKSQGLITNEIK